MPNYNLRWRVVDGKIPLLNRHYRALEPLNLPEPLRAWIHERLEWAADNSLYKDKDAIICLAIDPSKDVIVSLEDVRPTPELSLKDIQIQDGLITGITHNGQPLQGTVWLEQDDALTAAVATTSTALTTATDTLAWQLAQTLGIPATAAPARSELLSTAKSVFIISDEFGLIPIKPGGSMATKLADGFARLFKLES